MQAMLPENEDSAGTVNPVDVKLPQIDQLDEKHQISAAPPNSE
jgi:hypothetical protein